MYRMQSVSVPEKKLLLLVWQFSSKTIFRNQSGKPQNTIYSDHDEWWWGSSRSTVKKGKLHWIQNMWTNQLNSTITKKYFNFLQVDHCVFGNIARGSTDHIAWVKLGNYSRSHNALQFTGTHVCAIVNNQQWTAKANRGCVDRLFFHTLLFSLHVLIQVHRHCLLSFTSFTKISKFTCGAVPSKENRGCVDWLFSDSWQILEKYKILTKTKTSSRSKSINESESKSKSRDLSHWDAWKKYKWT